MAAVTTNERKYPRTGLRGCPQEFPHKLWEVLRDESTKGLQWTEAGDGFLITDFDLFAATSGASLGRSGAARASFQRQLNLYGFRKVTQGKNTGAYAHPSGHFVRDMPEEVRYISRHAQPKSGGNGRHRKSASGRRATSAGPGEEGEEEEEEEESERQPRQKRARRRTQPIASATTTTVQPRGDDGNRGWAASLLEASRGALEGLTVPSAAAASAGAGFDAALAVGSVHVPAAPAGLPPSDEHHAKPASDFLTSALTVPAIPPGLPRASYALPAPEPMAEMDTPWNVAPELPIVRA